MSNKTLYNLGKKLKELRTSKNLRAVDVSEKVGISRGHLSGIELNYRNVSEELLRKILIYGLDIRPSEANKLISTWQKGLYVSDFESLTSSQSIFVDFDINYETDFDLKERYLVIQFLDHYSFENPDNKELINYNRGYYLIRLKTYPDIQLISAKKIIQNDYLEPFESNRYYE